MQFSKPKDSYFVDASSITHVISIYTTIIFCIRTKNWKIYGHLEKKINIQVTFNPYCDNECITDLVNEFVEHIERYGYHINMPNGDKTSRFLSLHDANFFYHMKLVYQIYLHMVTLYGCTQMSSSKTIIVNNDTNK